MLIQAGVSDRTCWFHLPTLGIAGAMPSVSALCYVSAHIAVSPTTFSMAPKLLRGLPMPRKPLSELMEEARARTRKREGSAMVGTDVAIKPIAITSSTASDGDGFDGHLGAHHRTTFPLSFACQCFFPEFRKRFAWHRKAPAKFRCHAEVVRGDGYARGRITMSTLRRHRPRYAKGRQVNPASAVR